MHTKLLRTRRERYAAPAVTGLYDVAHQILHKFDSLTLDGQRKRLLTIGRARNCDIKPMDDPTVSSVHCNIHRQGDSGFVIEDTGSTNGLFANDVKVDRIALAPGMWIFVGCSEYVVVGPDGKIPIKARTTSSFLVRAVAIYGSVRRAASKVGKSRETIRRVLQRRKDEE